MRAIATPPSLNRFRPRQGHVNLAPRRLFRFLHEDPDNHHAPANGPHVQRSRNSAPALQPRFPQASLNVLHVRLTHALQTLLLDELRDTRQPRPHVFRHASTSASTVSFRPSTVQHILQYTRSEERRV